MPDPLPMEPRSKEGGADVASLVALGLEDPPPTPGPVPPPAPPEPA
ncbi:hypothetical protein [Streptomyces sp. NPDC057052]